MEIKEKYEIEALLGGVILSIIVVVIIFMVIGLMAIDWLVLTICGKLGVTLPWYVRVFVLLLFILYVINFILSLGGSDE